jgi:hypothetical protein
MAKKRKPTTDAVEILDRRYFEDDLAGLLAEDAAESGCAT